MAESEKWGEILGRAREDANRTLEELASLCKVSEGTISRYLGDNVFPVNVLGPLWGALKDNILAYLKTILPEAEWGNIEGIAFDNHNAIEGAGFKIGRKRTYRPHKGGDATERSDGPEDGDVLSRVWNEITKVQEGLYVKKAVERAGQLSRDVLGNLDQRHFFISSVTGIPMFIWDPADRYKMVPDRVTSILNKAMFVMMVPSKGYFNSELKQVAKYLEIKSHGQLIEGFHHFYDNALKEIARRDGVTNPKQQLDEGIQLIECDHFPFTGAGFAVCLLGEVRRKGDVRKDIMIHGPYEDLLLLQLFQGGNHWFGTAVFEWCLNAVSAARDQCKNSQRTRRDFFIALIERMNGKVS